MNKDFGKFISFARLQLKTGDYDAHIPFLSTLCDSMELSSDERIWVGLLYMAYYTEGSMWRAWRSPGVRGREKHPPLDLPITTQRRNLYGGRIKKHLGELMEIKSLTDWVGEADSWDSLLKVLKRIYGNGRWASYTTAELLIRLTEKEGLEPTGFEILQSSGPKQGLEFLQMPVAEKSALKILRSMEQEEIEIPMSVLESLLCDWSGMNKGSFYAGRNIDRQQGRILHVEHLRSKKTGNAVRFKRLWKCRRKCFPKATLGEKNGWAGIDTKRLKAYRDSGKILAPHEQR